MKSSLRSRILALANAAQKRKTSQDSPGFKWDFAEMDAQEKIWCAEIDAINKEAGPGLAVGRTLTFGVADGTATYIVTKIRKNDVVVEWIPMGDCYFSPAVGLSADITQYIILRSTAEQFCRFP
jgi:hypothetical protein